MTEFSYKAVAANGKIQLGSMEAASERDVIEQLRESGLLPISAAPSGSGPGWFSGIRWSRPRKPGVPRREITSLTHELGTLLQAGLSLDASLRLLAAHGQNKRLQAVVTEINEQIRAGVSLSEALAQHGELFDPLFLGFVRSGEASGNVAAALEQLAAYRDRTETFRKTLIASLTYPAILIGVCCTSLFVLMSFVVPRFVPLFSDSAAALPLLTRVVFAAGGFFQTTWWLFVLLFVIGVLGFRSWRMRGNNRQSFDRWLLSLPQLGELIRYGETARIMRTLGALTGNGIPLLAGIRLSRDVARNREFRSCLEEARSAVEQGSRLSDALFQRNAFPALAQELTVVGEESGQLDRMLLRVADTYEEKTSEKLARVLRLIEPVSILGLGTIIAMVIIAILMAMLSLNDIVV